MTRKSTPNVVRHAGHVCAAERAALLGQQPLTVWLTGLSAAGKSTLAFAIEREWNGRGHACYVLDGDNVRHGLNRNLGFSAADRSDNIRRIAEVARLMNVAGLIVITAFISPWRADRAVARQIIGKERFVEVHVSTPLAVCEVRDPKGFYGQARRGELAGDSSPHQAPERADLSIDTAQLSLADAVGQLTRLLARPLPSR
ncbi:MAG: adenylyl-sulfate kinase [Candidatus Accumulibacter propinquus]|jgi:adenylylsulfate kinase